MLPVPRFRAKRGSRVLQLHFPPPGIKNNNNDNIHLYGAKSNLKLLFGATNKNVNEHDQLGTLR